MLTNNKICGDKYSISPLQMVLTVFSIDELICFLFLLKSVAVSHHHVQKITSRLSILIASPFNTLNNRLIWSKRKLLFFEEDFLNKSLISWVVKVNELPSDTSVFEITFSKNFMSFWSTPYSHDLFSHGICHDQRCKTFLGMKL